MSDRLIEDMATEYLLKAKAQDSRVFSEYKKALTPIQAKLIFTQLKKWDVADQARTRPLKRLVKKLEPEETK